MSTPPALAEMRVPAMTTDGTDSGVDCPRCGALLMNGPDCSCGWREVRVGAVDTDRTETGAVAHPYRKRKAPDVEAVQVTESARHAQTIREWLGPWGWEPNTSAMRPGCVVVKTSLRSTDLAPPGDYIVRTKDGVLQVWTRERFEATYEPA